MIVYQLDYLGYYVGETVADESPLEPGVFLIPAGCITTPPPSIPEGRLAKWENGVWLLEAIPTPESEPEQGLPPPAPYILSKVDFLKRLTPLEWHSAKTSNLPEVMYFVDLILAANEIDLTDTQTKAGLSVAVAAGILTSERVEQILMF